MPNIELNGARVACTETGAGESVLLLHASATSRVQWIALTQSLGTRCRVLAPDLYGYGESDPWSGTGRFTLADEAALAEAVLPPGRGLFHLVGHSYGGAVALRLALQQPERLASLVLIEPVAFHLLASDLSDPDDRRLLQEVREIAALVSRSVLSGDYRCAMEHFVDYWNGTGTWLATKPEWQAELARRIPKVALDFRAVMTEPTAAPAYGRIDAPTLVLRGSRSPRPAQRVAEILAAGLPQGRLQTIEGAGHMLALTHKEAVNAAIMEHLLLNAACRRRPAAA